MDKLREKISNYRDQADQANARADSLVQQLNALQEQNSLQEREIYSLNNRNKQLEENLEKAQSEIERLKQGEGKEDDIRKEHEAALRKISLLETELENSDKALRETTQNFREADVKAEHFERKRYQLEAEIQTQEKKYDELQAKYQDMIKEFEELSSQLEQL